MLVQNNIYIHFVLQVCQINKPRLCCFRSLETCRRTVLATEWTRFLAAREEGWPHAGRDKAHVWGTESRKRWKETFLYSRVTRGCMQCVEQSSVWRARALIRSPVRLDDLVGDQIFGISLRGKMTAWESNNNDKEFLFSQQKAGLLEDVSRSVGYVRDCMD